MRSGFAVGWVFFLSLGVLPRAVAAGNASCQSTVTCSRGTATCTATPASGNDFYDEGECGAGDKYQMCRVARHYDRGSLVGQTGYSDVRYICCDSQGVALALQSATSMTAQCAGTH